MHTENPGIYSGPATIQDSRKYQEQLCGIAPNSWKWFESEWHISVQCMQWLLIFFAKAMQLYW